MRAALFATARLGSLRSLRLAAFDPRASMLARSASMRSITLLPAGETGASARDISLPWIFFWIAASTHEGEERIAAEAHRRLAEVFPDALTMIAPRHPERGPAVLAQLQGQGFACGLRSRGDRPGRETAIYICDTIGELGLFYRLAGIVLVGRSLTGAGGQNPIEPAKLASAILHGPHVANFADVYALLDAGGGAALIRDAGELAEILQALFADSTRLRAMARAAARTVEREAGAVDRAMTALGPRLAALAPAPT